MDNKDYDSENAAFFDVFVDGLAGFKFVYIDLYGLLEGPASICAREQGHFEANVAIDVRDAMKMAGTTCMRGTSRMKTWGRARRVLPSSFAAGIAALSFAAEKVRWNKLFLAASHCARPPFRRRACWIA